MKLYHSTSHRAAWMWILGILILSACSPPQATPKAEMQVFIVIEGENITLSIPTGSTVETALDISEIDINEEDRIDPPLYTLLGPGDTIQITRVREEFVVEQETIPFEILKLKTESLVEQEQLLAQNGVNGIRESTYRLVYEDDALISRQVVKSVVVSEAVPEIVMVGISQPFAPVILPGRLVYLIAGNAWQMESSTAARKPLITTGDLDGHIFNLSEDGTWLLFTRRSDEDDEINRLWAADLRRDPINIIDLEVSNIIHFADWISIQESLLQIIFSTVEPRQTAPGWQANNDLHQISFSPSGWVSQWTTIIETNSGGIYGWWGTQFNQDPLGNRMIYSRPDSIGWVEFENQAVTPLIEFEPVQTGGDWAWSPGIAWSPDGNQLYTVLHSNDTQNGSRNGSGSLENSGEYNLAVIPLDERAPIELIPQVGMFSYPAVSPDLGGTYQVAYLQAKQPLQSDTSGYNLSSMDRDGSNKLLLFPLIGQKGLEPQALTWSPQPLPEFNSFAVAVIYEGNIWLVPASGNHPPQQITGDGLVSHLAWETISITEVE